MMNNHEREIFMSSKEIFVSSKIKELEEELTMAYNIDFEPLYDHLSSYYEENGDKFDYQQKYLLLASINSQSAEQTASVLEIKTKTLREYCSSRLFIHIKSMFKESDVKWLTIYRIVRNNGQYINCQKNNEHTKNSSI
jgi:hypothetical protein